MKIAISTGSYGSGSVGGLERYVGELLGPLLTGAPGAIVYTGSPEVRERHPCGARRVRPAAASNASSSGNLLRLFWHQAVLPVALMREGADVFYSPVPEGMLASPCRQVVTVHDLIPLRYPETGGRVAFYYRKVLPCILQASSAIIAVSRATEEDLREHYGLEGTPVHVVYQGYRREVFRPAEDEMRPSTRDDDLGDFVLSVGEMRPYKNLRRLIEAFARLEVPTLQLLFAGNIVDRDLLELTRRLGIASRVRFLGRVSDEYLARLYRAARGFVFPSLYEGFGIPPLEAMACGCPVIASRRASIPEVCGDAAVYVDPYDVDDIAGAIQRVVGNEALRSELRSRGLAQAQLFSYEAAARQILAVVRNVGR